jgi:hypothetical protein
LCWSSETLSYPGQSSQSLTGEIILRLVQALETFEQMKEWKERLMIDPPSCFIYKEVPIFGVFDWTWIK